jgi:hypothetical protein
MHAAHHTVNQCRNREARSLFQWRRHIDNAADEHGLARFSCLHIRAYYRLRGQGVQYNRVSARQAVQDVIVHAAGKGLYGAGDLRQGIAPIPRQSHGVQGKLFEIIRTAGSQVIHSCARNGLRDLCSAQGFEPEAMLLRKCVEGVVDLQHSEMPPLTCLVNWYHR